MNVRVLYFAAARERAGLDQESIALDEGSLPALTAVLTARHPGLAPLLPRLRFAVNQGFVAATATLHDGDEVALIPPVAGGSGRFRVGPEVLSLSEVVDAVSGPGRGGIVTFTGTVRGQSHGKNVRRLEYEAYGEMAVGQLAAIALETEEQWPGALVAIHHRTGVLEAGEAAVVIAAAAPHRKEAFRACEHAIERLKQDVAIWKKEVYEDGEEWVGLGP